LDPAFIGQISLFALGFAPIDYFPCDGRTLSVNSYQPLYALIGQLYGGDGKTNFKVPDLRGFEPIPNLHYCIAYNGEWPQRQD
jgi:microcystin-dependent protein